MEPIILSEEILTQAREWQDECILRQNEKSLIIRIGEAVLVSPVDGTSNKVVLYMCDDLRNGGKSVKGKTLIGVYSVDGNRVEEGGRTVAVKKHLPPAELRRALLHELTHTVDPTFEGDVQKQKELYEQAAKEGRPVFNNELYAMPSEQRAFVTMLMEDLREDLANGLACGAGVVANRYKEKSKEFDGFIGGYCQIGHPAEYEQALRHIRQIVDELRRRAGNGTTPSERKRGHS
jgi:hypothetical protein